MEDVTAASDRSNKENAPTLPSKSLIPPLVPSFKTKGRRRLNINRIPLADITNLFIHSASHIGVSEIPLSILPHSNRRRRTEAIPYTKYRIFCSKSLRMGFR
ncbi:hypothetical protein QN277_002709 [Acacia crassicarpa]|uniref:Uncharacterized protein n=1 Tax=Acacia crassicarpa TaxID=499986 RepID=A0AAE1TID3_9FABA|nr:hypothetical protein QN277_002709 [Acacia crassicarpa]